MLEATQWHRGGKWSHTLRTHGCLGQGAINSTAGYCVLTPWNKGQTLEGGVRGKRQRGSGGWGGGDFLLTWHFQMKLLRKSVKSSEINEKFPPLLNSSHNRGGPFKCKQMSFKTLKWHEELQSQSPPPPKHPLQLQSICLFHQTNCRYS